MKKCHSKDPCAYFADGDCTFTRDCDHHIQFDHQLERATIELPLDWTTSERLRSARQAVMFDATQNSRTITEKEETCPIHKRLTVYTGILGLWVCPDCARVYFNKPIAVVNLRKPRLPYREEEPPEIVDDNELDKFLSGERQ